MKSDQRKPGRERYPLTSSPLFRLHSQRKLALVLGTSRAALRKFASAIKDDPSSWYRLETRLIGNKHRDIQCPIGDFRGLHEKTKTLLGRVNLPDYLYAPRTGRTFLANALQHIGANQLAKLDIRHFYPSTTSEHVFRFFRYDLEMADDVAGLMTKLMTIDGHLPFGSPVSPILAFLTFRRTFDEIDAYVRARNLRMTLFVDDLTISGAAVPVTVVDWVKDRIQLLGLIVHKIRVQSRRRGFEVTGVRIDRKGVAPLNRANIKIRDELAKLKRRLDPFSKQALIRRLIGLNGHRLVVLSPDHPLRPRAIAFQRHYRNADRMLDLAIQRAGDIGPVNGRVAKKAYGL